MKNFPQEIVKYFCAVAIAVALDFFVYTILYYIFLLGAVASNLLAFAVGTLCSVVLIRTYVFKDARYTTMVDYLLTLLSNGWIYLLGMVVLVFLIERLYIHHYVAKTLIMTITFVLNYYIRKYVFTKKREYVR